MLVFNDRGLLTKLWIGKGRIEDRDSKDNITKNT